MKQYLAFLCAGGTGFVVDAAMLFAMVSWAELDPLTGRLVSILVALGVTWILNRSLTFGKSRRSLVVEGVRYGSVGATSAIVNYGIYFGLLAASPAITPLVALVVASFTATVLSYLGYSRLVFRH